MIERPDLDGLRLHDLGQDEVWLMFHGRRHKVADGAVFEALFSETTTLTEASDLSAVAKGFDLAEGTCLIQDSGSGAVFLLVPENGSLRRYFIPTYEIFLDFQFSTDAIFTVPSVLAESVQGGRQITSAHNRLVE